MRDRVIFPHPKRRPAAVVHVPVYATLTPTDALVGEVAVPISVTVPVPVAVVKPRPRPRPAA